MLARFFLGEFSIRPPIDESTEKVLAQQLVFSVSPCLRGEKDFARVSKLLVAESHNPYNSIVLITSNLSSSSKPMEAFA